jgi:alpha-2-macroglobulin
LAQRLLSGGGEEENAMNTKSALALGLFATALLAALPEGCGTATTKAPATAARALWPDAAALGDGDGAFRVAFDAPMVPEEAVGAALSPPPISISPAVPLAAAWIDRQTLAVEPKEPLAPSTTYAVRLEGDLAARVDPADRELRFAFRPLEITRAFGFDTAAAEALPRIGLAFNQDVEASQLELLCAIESDDRATRIPVDAPSSDLVGDEMVLFPSRPLEQGAAYALACDGLTGAGGDAPMPAPYELRFSTYAKLDVVGFAPEGTDVWSDEVELRVAFSTPVNPDAARAAIRAFPEIPGLERATLGDDGKELRAVVDLKSERKYAVRVSGDLVDVHGQRLGADRSFSFATGVARPRLEMATGITAVEARNRGGALPVWTRNLAKFDVDCAAVPERAAVGLLTGDMNYDPWYDAGTQGPLDWKALGLKHRKASVRAGGVVDAWRLQDLDLPKLCAGKTARGVFLAEVSSKELAEKGDEGWQGDGRKRVLANVTDLGVLLKVGAKSSLLWVTRLSDGAVVDGAAVRVYSPQGKLVYSGATGPDGLAAFPGANALLGGGAENSADAAGEEEYDTWRSRRLIAVVEKDRDTAIVDGNWSNGIQVWNFGVEADTRGGDTRLRAFLMTDRGVYRPGETVHVKGLVREVALGRAPAVPAGERVSLRVEDSRGEEILSKKIAVGEFGGFAVDLRLGAGAALGDYTVRLAAGGQTFSEAFAVEEFEKVSYEVKVGAKARHARLGAPLKLTVDAGYLFGAPVADAQVRWSVMRRPHFLEFDGLEAYTFRDDAAEGYGYWWWDRYENESYSFVEDGEGKTDAKGALSFSISDKETGLSGPEDYIVQATVEDATGESVSARTTVTAHKSTAYVGLHAEECVQAVGMPFAVHAVAVAPDGARVAQEATLKYVRERQRCDRRGAYRERVECETQHEVVWSRRVRIPATGAAVERIMPEEPGEYVVRLEAVDARGNAIAASSLVWVLGKGEAFWSGDESVRMSLVPSKTEYEPGETARLAPRSSVGPSTALLTLERDGILEAKVLELGGSGEGVEVPITEAMAPNVYASLALVKGRTGEGDGARPRFQIGVAELKVSAERARLKVAVETERPAYEPGEKVRGVLRVTSGGEPVRAEVALSVADEGVLQLIAFRTPDPMAAFYAPWGLGVDDAANLNRIARLDDPRTRDPDEGGDSGGAGKPRTNFVSSAFFQGDLVTDALGEAPFEFTAPDDLTAFRLMAVAADAGSRFGSGDARVQIAKPLMLEPLVPRFATAGDSMEVGALVRNATGAGGEVTVSMRATGCAASVRERKISLADGGSAVVRFPVKISDASKARFTFRAELGGRGDAVSVEAPIARSIVADARVISRGPISGKAPLRAEPPAGAVPGESAVEIAVDRAGLSELQPSLAYLVEYPYGCLEQTLSRLIPLVEVKELSAALGMKELEGARLDRYIDVGLAKVVRHQHDDGQFSLWPGGETYPHLTAFALYGLAVAKRANLRVDEAALARGEAALKTWIDGRSQGLPSDGDAATLAMAAHVLAELGRPDAGLNARLFERRQGLPVYGRAFLLMALAADGGAQGEAETLARELEALVRSEGGAAHVHETGRDLALYWSSDVRTEAILLSALLRADPDAEAIPGLAEGLRRAQLSQGRWGNTQDNLYALVALADYAKATSAEPLRVTVRNGGAVVVSKEIAGHGVFTARVPIAGPAALELETSAPARHLVRLVSALREDAAIPSDRGLSISRELLAPTEDAPTGRVKVGDLVRVRVTVRAPEDRRYVAVVDRLPAGLEPVNARFATSEETYREPPSSSWYWRPGWTHTELKDDRALAFADTMEKGELVLEYLARAATPGRFTALPATAEEMYEPDVNGRTASYALEVLP